MSSLSVKKNIFKTPVEVSGVDENREIEKPDTGDKYCLETRM